MLKRRIQRSLIRIWPKISARPIANLQSGILRREQSRRTPLPGAQSIRGFAVEGSVGQTEEVKDLRLFHSPIMIVHC
jgi:hypothetical protein